MIYEAIYHDGDDREISTVTFDAPDLTQALKIVCTTQVTPEGADTITITPRTEDRRV